jgi:uncharacterized RDD family membrane protein YckC
MSADTPVLRNSRQASGADDPLADFFLDRDTSPGGGGHLRADSGGGVATMAPPTAPIVTSELPLFVRNLVEEEEEDLTPLVKVPARPRQPLGVRRPTPDPAKLRAKYAPAEHEPDLLDAADADAAPAPFWTPMDTPSTSAGAAVGPRLAAAAIDAGVLGAIAATTVAFTLRLVELPFAEVGALPVIPMLAFFAVISLGYELMFTAANGQTIGKMVMGLRVVSDNGDAGADRVTLRQAALRAVSMLPLGAGLVAAFSGNGLAVHDRVAHTRVVRA